MTCDVCSQEAAAFLEASNVDTPTIEAFDAIVAYRHATEHNPLPKGVLSPSQVRLYLTCGEAYRYRYVEGRKAQPSLEMVLGRIVHRYMEAYLTNTDTFTALLLEDLVRNELADAKLEAKDGGKAMFAEAKRVGEALIKWFDQMNWKPILIEEKLTRTIGDDEEIGYIDMLFETEDGRVLVADWKTTERSPANGVAARFHQHQLLTYADMAKQQGRKVDGAVAVYVVRQAKTVKVVPCEVAVTDASIAWAKRITIGAYEGIGRRNYVANPSAWMCGRDKCAYFNDCEGAPKHEEK